MARTRSGPMGRSKRQARAQRELQEKGWLACAAGVALLVVLPLLAGRLPQAMANAVVQGLQPVGWLALGIGVVLLGLHYAVRGRSTRMQLVAGGQGNGHPGMARRQQGRLSMPGLADEAPEPQRPPVEWASTLGSSWGTEPLAANERAEPALQPPSQQTADASASDANKTSALISEWSMAVFAAIEWRRFEAVCEALFAQAGFETHAQSHGADGGVDIWLHSRNSPGPAAVVQCKHWQSKPVGVREMREFFGVMASHKLRRGTYATTSTYTADALEFARANGIHTLDGAGLLQLIARRTPAQQQALLQVAYEGEYWRPTCASCGIKMLERKRGRDGNLFWGCANYPTCRRTLPKAQG